ncbi:hypothetical protein ACQ27_gp015 [Klebsiella phage K64-1]|nr:hypothetical protein ACQ27_gp015 [Klebsiella phage K64-1]
MSLQSTAIIPKSAQESSQHGK